MTFSDVDSAPPPFKLGRMVYLFASLWALSFFFSLPLVQPYEYARLAAFALAAFALVLALIRAARRPVALRKEGMTGLLLLLWLWAGLSILWSVSPFVSAIAWGTFSLLPFWFLTFLLLPERAVALRASLWAAVVMIAALALWALLQYFVFTGFLVKAGHVRHPFGDPNNYAALLNLGIFSALALGFSARTRGLIIAVTLAAVMAAAQGVIGGRAALIILAFGLVVLIFALRRLNTTLRIGRAAAVLLLTLGLFLGIAQGFSATRESPLERFAGFTGADKSVESRLDIWRSSLSLLRADPWRGHGAGTYFLLYPGARAPAESYSSGLMAHSDPLQFAVEMGLPAAFLFYAFLFAALRRARRMKTPAGLCLFTGLGGLVLHAHISFHFYVASILVMAALVLAAWHAQTEEETLATPAPFPAPLAAVMVALLAFFVFTMQGVLRSEYHASRAAQLARQSDVQKLADEINAANRAGFGLNPRPYVFAASVPLALLMANPALEEREVQALQQQTDDLLVRAEKAGAHQAGLYYYRGLLYAQQKDKRAADEFLRALAVEPAHLPSRLMAAQELRRQGRGDEAYEVLKAGLPWRYALHDARPLYAETARQAAARREPDVTQEALLKLGYAERKIKRRTRGHRGAAEAEGAVPLP